MSGWVKENRMAMELGFICLPDKSRGEGWCMFAKGQNMVWSNLSGGWTSAIIENSMFTDQKDHELLLEALNRFTDIQLTWVDDEDI